jgi:hypothetical protein
VAVFRPTSHKSVTLVERIAALIGPLGGFARAGRGKRSAAPLRKLDLKRLPLTSLPIRPFLHALSSRQNSVKRSDHIGTSTYCRDIQRAKSRFHYNYVAYRGIRCQVYSYCSFLNTISWEGHRDWERDLLGGIVGTVRSRAATAAYDPGGGQGAVHLGEVVRRIPLVQIAKRGLP